MNAEFAPSRRAMLFASLGILAIPSLAACGTTQGGTSGGEGGGNAAGAMVTVPKLTGIAWFNRMEEGVKEYAKKTSENAYYQGSSEADAAAQVKVLEDLIASKVAAICVTPFQPDAVEQTLKKAMDAGIKVVIHEAPSLK